MTNLTADPKSTVAQGDCGFNGSVVGALHQIRDGAIWSAIATACSRIFPAILTLMLAWLLTPQELGVISLLLAYYTILTMLADWGTTCALQRFIPESPSNTARITWTALILRLVLAGVLGLGCWVLDLFTHKLRGYGIYMPLLLISWAFAITIYAEYALLRFRKGGLLSSLISAAGLLITPLLVLLGFRISGPMWGIAIPFLAVGLYVLLTDPVLRHRIVFDPLIARKLLKFGAWATASSTLSTFVIQIGIVVAAYGAGDKDAAVLRVASTLAVVPTLLGYIVVQPLFPVASRSLTRGTEQMAEVARLLARYLLLVGIPLVVGGAVLARPLLQTLFSPAYLAGVNAVRLLLFGNLFFMLFTALSAIPMMSAGLKEFTAYNLIIGCFALLTTVVSVHRWGVTGVAGGQCLSAILGFLLIRHWLKRHLSVQFEWSRCFIFVLCACEMAAVVALTIRALPTPVAQVGVGTAVGVGIYFTALFLQRGLTRQEIYLIFRRAQPAAA